MVLLIDNYDSFTYNLYQLAGSCRAAAAIRVIKNDELTVAQIQDLAPTHIIISPGAGRPHKAGICEEAVLALKDTAAVLGVCLGHQAICEAFGGEITYAPKLMHGKKSNIHIANGSPLFKGLPPVIEAARYHSLCAKRDTLPDNLLIIAEDNDGVVMGVKHRDYEIYGLQFHPESILTKDGHIIMKNFLRIGGADID